MLFASATTGRRGGDHLMNILKAVEDFAACGWHPKRQGGRKPNLTSMENRMTEAVTMSVEALQSRVVAIFERAGLNKIKAAALAHVIVAGERDACKSHGIYRIEGVLRTVKAGKVKPDAAPVLAPDDGSAIVRVDARGGFANAAFELGVPALAERATRLGIAAMIVNDCSHFSALWPEVEALTAHGLAALVMCPRHATVAPEAASLCSVPIRLPSAGLARTSRLMCSILPLRWPRAARSNCTAALASNCRKVGRLTLPATQPLTRLLRSKVQ